MATFICYSIVGLCLSAFLFESFVNNIKFVFSVFGCKKNPSRNFTHKI